MTATTDPSTLFVHSLELIARADLDGWLALFSDDVVFEFPFAPDERPARVVGREALGEYMRTYVGQVESASLQNLSIHKTDDPRVVVVEMTVRGTHRATNTLRDTSYVVVVTAVDGQITNYRDYWNPNGGKLVVDLEGAA